MEVPGGGAARAAVALPFQKDVSKLLRTCKFSLAEARPIGAAIRGAQLGGEAEAALLWTLGEQTAPKRSDGGDVPVRAKPGRSRHVPARADAGGAGDGEKPDEGAFSQNWPGIIYYCTESIWDSVKVTGSFHPILDLACTMGLRHASAVTMQTIAVAALLHSKGVGKTMEMRPEDRTELVHLVGKELRRRTPRLPAPDVWIKNLPCSPWDFWRDYPAVAERVFSQELEASPEALPFLATDLERLKVVTRCRKPKGALSGPSSHEGDALALMSPPSAGKASPPPAWMVYMKEGMEQMAALTKQVSRLQAAQREEEEPLCHLTYQEDKRATAASSHGERPALPPPTEPPPEQPPHTTKARPGAMPGPATKKPRLSVADASKLILNKYINVKRKPAGDEAAGAAKEAAAADEEDVDETSDPAIPGNNSITAGRIESCSVFVSRYKDRKGIR